MGTTTFLERAKEGSNQLIKSVWYMMRWGKIKKVELIDWNDWVINNS